MSRGTDAPTVSVAVPVYNGARTLTPVIESVLGQDFPHLELVLSDNASTDGTQDICRHFARLDERVVYLRHAENIGLLNNFRRAAQTATGRYLRWLGDDDTLAPDHLSRTLEMFAEDRSRVLVTTQIVYTDDTGARTLNTHYDPTAMSSADPVERFAEMLRLLTSGFALIDPLYATMRRELAVLPRRSFLREDEVYAARLALAGPWGHVAAPLAHRNRTETPASGLTRLLGVPGWHRHVMDLLQCRELLDWVDRSALDPAQRRRARAEVLRMYARRKKNALRRGVTKLERMTGRRELAPQTW